MKRVVMVLVDGMRPDGMTACGHPVVGKLMDRSVYTMDGRTVMPSVTLPCHVSLFHSVPPQRHGILTNTYVPQVRPIRGICEVLNDADKRCAMFYTWEQLRDLSRPGDWSHSGSLCYANFIAARLHDHETVNQMLTKNAIHFLKTESVDFTFIYFGWPDSAGHNHGWMSGEYMRSVRGSLDCVETVMRTLSDEDLFILTADHGGHDRRHGEDIPEDMVIPIFFYHPRFAAKKLVGANIIDIAPTIASYLGVAPDAEWEGKTLLCKRRRPGSHAGAAGPRRPIRRG